MYTLDQDIEITINQLSIATGGTYQYEVQISQPNQTFNTIFVGNCWLNAGETKKTFYLNNILNNCRSGFDNLLTNNQSVIVRRDITIYETVRVVLHITPVITKQATKNVYFAYRYPNQKYYLEEDFNFRTAMGEDLVYNLIQPGLLPHIPFTNTTEFPFGVAMQFNRNLNNDLYFVFDRGIDSTYWIDIPTGTYNQPEIYLQNLSDWYDTAYSLGGDGLLTIKTDEQYIEVFEEQDTSINLVQPAGTYAWTDMGDGKYELGQPIRLEVYAGYSNEPIITLTPDDDLYNTEQATYDNEVEVDFINSDTRKIEIRGYINSNQYGSIFITCPTWFKGLKTLYFSFDWLYSEYDQAGYLFNMYASIYIPDKVHQEVAIIDACPAKFYLVWYDRFGGIQSQPFGKTETYSESLTYETTKNYKDELKHSSIKVQPKWKINSGWLDEKLLPYYESIFVSPQLLLYDYTNDKGYSVNITDTSYTEKSFKNQGRKLFNMNLTLEQNKIQNLIY